MSAEPRYFGYTDFFVEFFAWFVCPRVRESQLSRRKRGGGGGGVCTNVCDLGIPS